MNGISGDREAPDLYCDQFQSNIGPYGCILNFLTTQPTPPVPGNSLTSVRRATIRMSLEHLKVMVFLLLRQVRQFEAEQGIRIEIPRKLLNEMGIGFEDWEAVWGRE